MIDTSIDWQEEHGYAVGVLAYLYGFPYLYFSFLRWMWVTQDPGEDPQPYAAVNDFWHARRLSLPGYRGGGSPNNDTLYSTAWVDVGREPVVLSVAPTDGRYWSFQLTGFDGENFAVVGSRTYGDAGGTWAITGPAWSGTLPDGVEALRPSQTPWLFVLGRTGVRGRDDLGNVAAVQDGYRLASLSKWRAEQVDGRSAAAANAAAASSRRTEPEVARDRRDVLVPMPPAGDPLAEWRTLNLLLAENPPPDRHAPLLAQFASVNVGPGLDPYSGPDSIQRGLARAIATGRAIIDGLVTQQPGFRMVNGWKLPPSTVGHPGDDFLLRAMTVEIGFVATDPEENIYSTAYQDAEGQALTGQSRYRLSFPPDQLPDVSEFWSLTMYGMDNNLVDNPINRYSIGDRTEGLAFDRDGGLTVVIQHLRPRLDDGKEAASGTWLPAPPDAFYLIFRAYGPGPAIVKGRWAPPPVQRVQ